MSKSMIGEQSLAEMTEGRAAETAHVWTEGEIAATQDDAAREKTSLLELAVELQHSFFSRRLSTPNEDSATKGKAAKHRFGLPQGFVSRLGRYGRPTLIQDNIYRLPNGLEFIPQPPTGTLGSKSHQYALLTEEQFKKKRRGSVYVKTDGRIFDYAWDHRDAEREMFDTGFTLGDLERTGRYAPRLTSNRRSSKDKKVCVKRGRK